MPRRRSISYYAHTEKEYLEICDEVNIDKNINSLYQRRRRRYNTSINSENNEMNENQDKFIKNKFASYDDLEFDQLGINSTYQIEQIENEEEDKDTEVELLTKINNLNLSFKQKNKDNFIINFLACSKHIINSNYTSNQRMKINDFNEKNKKLCGQNKIKPFKLYNENDDLSEEKNNNKINYNSSEDDECSGIGSIDSSSPLSIRNLIENQNNKNTKKEESEDNNNFSELNYINKNSPQSSTITSSLSSNEKELSNDKYEEKKTERSQTFDHSKFSEWYNYSNDKNERMNNIQNKKIQEFIKKNYFLSKNIDYVDEHLKFLISGTDKKTKQLFISILLNEKKIEKECIYDFNIFKKIIKLLGDFIKLELLVEDCNLCYSIMLNLYLSIVNGLILTIDINEPSSAKYAYELFEKVKYNINLNQKYFSIICICFNLTEIIKNEENIKKTKEIIKNIKNDFNIKTYFINYSLNVSYNNDNKLENIINKYLSLAYLKKERKDKIYKYFDTNRKRSTLN